MPDEKPTALGPQERPMPASSGNRADDSVPDDSVTDDSVTDDSVTDDSVTDDSVTDDSVTDDDVDFHHSEGGDTGTHAVDDTGAAAAAAEAAREVAEERRSDPDEDNALTAPTPRVQIFDDLVRARETGYLAQLRLPGTEEDEVAPRRSRPPLLVWVFTGLFVSLMTMCTFLYPAFTGYDEPFHVDMTYSYYNGNGFYAPADRLLSIGVQNANGTVHPPPATPFSSQHVLPRGERKSFDTLGGDAAGTYPIPNQMVQHPPLYYWVGAGILHLFPGSHHYAYDRWVAILRYVSILMLAPLPLLAWASARALVGDGTAAVTAAALPLTLPNLARLGGSWNNDDGLTLLTALLIFLLAKVVAGDLRKRTGFLVGLITGLACLTKGYALVLPVVVVGAYAVAWLRHRRRPWAAVGWAALLTAGVGGWWWVRNLILFHQVQPEGFGGPGSFGYDTFYQTNQPRPGYTVHEFIPSFLVRVLWRTWGGIGYPEDPFFSKTVCWVWFGIVAVGAALAVGFGLRGRWGRASAALFCLPVPLILALPMYNALHHYTFNGLIPGAQGRYLYPAVTAVGVLVGVGYTRVLGRRLAPWLPLVVVVGALGTQLIAWRALVHVWWVPASAGSDRSNEVKQAFRGILRWSPWPHPVTTGPFVAVLAFGVLVLVTAIGYGWRHRADTDEPVVTDDRTAATTGRPVPVA